MRAKQRRERERKSNGRHNVGEKSKGAGVFQPCRARAAHGDDPTRLDALADATASAKSAGSTLARLARTARIAASFASDASFKKKGGHAKSGRAAREREASIAREKGRPS